MLTMTGFGAEDWLTALQKKIGAGMRTAYDASFFKLDPTSGAYYGKGVAEVTGWTLQATLNRFVGSGLSKRVGVDGWVGAETVAATVQVANKIYEVGIRLDMVKLLLSTDNPLTPLVLVRNIENVISLLNMYADDHKLPKATPFTIPSGAKEDKAPPPSAPPLSVDTGTSIWWYILGAVVLAGAGTVGYIVYKRRKNRALSTERV